MTVNKNELVRLLNLCLENTGLPSPGPIESPFLLRSRGGRSFSLVDEGVTAYHRVIGELLRERQIADRYSIKAIQEKLDLTLIDLLQLGQPPLAEATLRSNVESLLATFQEDFPQTHYYLAVANLRIEDALELGPVIIEPLTQHKLDTLFEQLDAIVDANPHHSDSEKANLKDHFRRYFQPWVGHALAHTTLSVETRKGAELSRRFLEEALHTLRFLGGFLYREENAALIAEVGEVHRGGRGILALKEGRFDWYHDETGPLYPFELRANNLQQAESLGLTELQAIMRKDVEQRTKIEKALLNAVFWVSRALTDDSAEGRLIKLCIAIESALLRRTEPPLGKTMAQRLAFLLSDRPEDRLGVYKTAKKLYDVRSDIAHEGFSAQAEAYLPIARWYALQSISRVLRRYLSQGWASLNDLASWFDMRMLGGEEATS